MIEDIIKKLIKTENRISEEKGSFNFFGLFKRTDLEDTWDLIISAFWFSTNKQADLIYIIKEIRKDLNIEDLSFLTRVVLIKPEDKFIKKLNMAINIQHGMTEMINTQIDGIRLRHAYIITSKK